MSANIHHSWSSFDEAFKAYKQEMLGLRHSLRYIVYHIGILNRMLLVSLEAERMAVMVSQLLDAERIEENRMELNFYTMNLAALISGMVGTFYPVLNKNHNTLLINLPPDTGDVWCDTERIR